MKVSTTTASIEIVREFQITEDHPIVGFEYASTPKDVRIIRGSIAYAYQDGRWIVPNAWAVKIGGPVLKKDGTDSKNDHTRRPGDIYSYAGVKLDLTAKLAPDFQWLIPIIDLLRPTGDLSMTKLTEAEVD